MSTLPTLGGSANWASAINSSGQIVGTSYTSGTSGAHAFLYSNGQMTNLGTLGGPISEADAINDSGQVVGSAYTGGQDTIGNPISHAYLYSNGAMHDLDALGSPGSVALGINNAGQIVGRVRNAPGATPLFKAVLFQNNKVYDLNAQLDHTYPGWTLDTANAINNNGWIAGTGIFNGRYHAVLLVPV
jgi:probable HAF family extracellular repeat protein